MVIVRIILALVVFVANLSAGDLPFRLYAPWTPGETWRAGNNKGDGYFYGMGVSGTTHKKYASGLDDTYAIDFNMGGGDSDQGKPILSAHAGRIKMIQVKAGYGWVLDLVSLDGHYITRYAHLQEDPRLLPGIEVGKIIQNGVQIGKCGGTTADANDGVVYKKYSSHLHFVLYQESQNVSIRPTPLSGVDLDDSGAGTLILSNNIPENLIKITMLQPKASECIEISGMNFGDTAGKVQVVVPWTVANDDLFRSHGILNGATSSLVLGPLDVPIISWTDTTIKALPFRNTIDWDKFKGPMWISVVKSDGKSGGTASFPFGDIDNNSWGCDDITALWKIGVIKGKGNGLFEPNMNVSRIELVIMLVRSKLKLSPASAPSYDPFSDVPRGMSNAGFVAAAVDAGWNLSLPITPGMSSNVFRPFADATRLDTAVMIVSAFGFKGPGIKQSWWDYNEAIGYAPRILGTYKIMNGYSNDNSFRPNATLTRAMAAIIINRAMTTSPQSK